jgi:hypothetical protein
MYAHRRIGLSRLTLSFVVASPKIDTKKGALSRNASTESFQALVATVGEAWKCVSFKPKTPFQTIFLPFLFFSDVKKGFHGKFDECR